MNIDSKVLDVLSNAEVSGNSLKLTGQLDRALYVSVNKVLEAAGGKWNRKAQAHTFESDAEELMEQIILTGKVINRKQELGYFPTPPAVVDRLIELADIQADQRVLEPSVGNGNIAKALFKAAPIHLVVAEIDAIVLKEFTSGYQSWLNTRIDVHHGDFLTTNFAPFDRVVMNPPFGRNVSPKHVLHAHSILKPNGLLVSVMPSSVTFRTDALNTRLRSMADSIETLPEGSFVESGTNVNTVIVTMHR